MFILQSYLLKFLKTSESRGGGYDKRLELGI